MELASVRGCRRIELTARADHPRAIRLCQTHIFILEGRLRDAERIDGQSHDLFLMAKLLPNLAC
ncbi:hypothetical protein C2I19_06555 [Chromobacterium alticapitis]|uniref:N-acetyltransferase domain-containing protein n=1 Tax=Chromobacterium alticapitis TaxID=2073169 RepID=A0A2S5DIE5_9NEIS|nr:hypothetical protein C2I19_06555 [Chromobacterium alticapitis]